jgi:hypothetical protein
MRLQSNLLAGAPAGVSELKRTAVVVVCTLGAFTVITALFFARYLQHLQSALIGPPGDNLQDYWNTWYAATQVSGHFFFTQVIRFPAGTPLYYHSFDYPQIEAVALLSKVVGSAPPTLHLLHNITLLASFPLAGVGGFFLTRHFTRDHLGSSIGGFVFAFSPWHVEQVMQHAHVSSIEFIPMFILAYLLALERRSVGWLCAAIILYALSALSCWYYLVYLGYFLVFNFFTTTIQKTERNRYWPIGAPVVCAVGTFVALSPLILPMMSQAMRGLPVYADPYDSKKFVADVAAYVAFPPTHIFASVGEPIYRRLTGTVWEATVYLGIVNLGALTWAWFRSEGRDRQIFAYLLAGMATFAVFASGDELHVVGHRAFAMPGALLSGLPFLANVRTPSRAIVFVYLFLSVGVGLAMKLAFDRYQRPVAKIGLAGGLLLLLLDFFPLHIDSTRIPCQPGWAVIRNDSSSGYGILMLPRGLWTGPIASSGYFAQNVYMYEQAACHGRPIVQGTTSRNVVTGLLEELKTDSLAAQRKILVDSKVKYIVIDHAFPWDEQDGIQSEYSRAYPVIYDAADLTILRVY